MEFLFQFHKKAGFVPAAGQSGFHAAMQETRLGISSKTIRGQPAPCGEYAPARNNERLVGPGRIYRLQEFSVRLGRTCDTILIHLQCSCHGISDLSLRLSRTLRYSSIDYYKCAEVHVAIHAPGILTQSGPALCLGASPL